MPTERKVADALRDRKKTLAIAESCSGGLLSHRLTDIPGSSEFLKLAIVTYSNDSKSKLLKIPAQKIKKYGAVSEEVALAMSKGVRKILRTDFGISITGIAGPSGGTPSKPVGLTFISVSTAFDTICLRCEFTGSRRQIKRQATEQALKLLTEFL